MEIGNETNQFQLYEELKNMNSSIAQQVLTTENGKEEKDYPRLIAAQNESARRLKIKGIQNTLTEENKKKRGFAIASGICFAGVVAATYFSGIDPNQAIQTEIQALNSFSALREYLGYITPAMWGTIAATAASISEYLRHKKKYDNANQEFYDMVGNEPVDYQNIVEQQAKSR